jgi:hypothetical protein
MFAVFEDDVGSIVDNVVGFSKKSGRAADV